MVDENGVPVEGGEEYPPQEEKEIPPCPYCGEEHYPFGPDATPWTEPDCSDG